MPVTNTAPLEECNIHYGETCSDRCDMFCPSDWHHRASIVRDVIWGAVCQECLDSLMVIRSNDAYWGLRNEPSK